MDVVQKIRMNVALKQPTIVAHGGMGSGFTKEAGHKGRKGLIGGSQSSISSTYREFSYNRKGDTMIWGKEMFNEANLSEEEKASLVAYKKDSNPINEELRSPDYFASDSGAFPFVRRIDDAISKSTVPDNVFTYRGINQAVFKKEHKVVGSLVGNIIDDKAFVSTTLHRKQALSWSWMNGSELGVVLEIALPKGSHALYMDDPSIMDRGEYELLLPRGTKFRVTSDTMENWFGEDVRFVKTEIVK